MAFDQLSENFRHETGLEIRDITDKKNDRAIINLAKKLPDNSFSVV
jgi:hypothetical protein